LASLFPVRFSFQQDELKSIDVENGVSKKPNKGKMGYRKGKNVGESRSDHLQSVFSFL
jgi:hypothetical protein